MAGLLELAGKQTIHQRITDHKLAVMSMPGQSSRTPADAIRHSSSIVYSAVRARVPHPVSLATAGLKLQWLLPGCPAAPAVQQLLVRLAGEAAQCQMRHKAQARHCQGVHRAPQTAAGRQNGSAAVACHVQGWQPAGTQGLARQGFGHCLGQSAAVCPLSTARAAAAAAAAVAVAQPPAKMVPAVNQVHHINQHEESADVAVGAAVAAESAAGAAMVTAPVVVPRLAA